MLPHFHALCSDRVSSLLRQGEGLNEAGQSWTQSQGGQVLCADSTKQPRVTPASATDRGQAALYLRQTSLYPWRAHCLLLPDSFAPALAGCERAGVNTPA